MRGAFTTLVRGGKDGRDTHQRYKVPSQRVPVRHSTEATEKLRLREREVRRSHFRKHGSELNKHNDELMEGYNMHDFTGRINTATATTATASAVAATVITAAAAAAAAATLTASSALSGDTVGPRQR